MLWIALSAIALTVAAYLTVFVGALVRMPPVVPSFEPFVVLPPGDVPPSAAEFLRETTAALQAEGFRSVGDLLRTDVKLAMFLRFLVHDEAHVAAHLSVLKGSRHVSFKTCFAGGVNVTTTGAPTDPHFKPGPKGSHARFPEACDVRMLYRLHQHAVERNRALGPALAAPAGEEAAFFDGRADVYPRQAAMGLFRRVGKGYARTVRGALRTVLLSIEPTMSFARWVERLVARARMRAILGPDAARALVAEARARAAALEPDGRRSEIAADMLELQGRIERGLRLRRRHGVVIKLYACALVTGTAVLLAGRWASWAPVWVIGVCLALNRSSVWMVERRKRFMDEQKLSCAGCGRLTFEELFPGGAAYGSGRCPHCRTPITAQPATPAPSVAAAGQPVG